MGRNTYGILTFAASLTIIAVICGILALLATWGEVWWLIPATPIGLIAGLVAWFAVRGAIDRRWYH